MGSRNYRVITIAIAVLTGATRKRGQTVALAASLCLVLALGGLAAGRLVGATNATESIESQRTWRTPAIPGTAAVRSAASRAVGLINSGCGDPLFGSGFAVARGYIVTNAHVVAGAHGRLVAVSNGRSARATVVLFDPENDVALLRTPHQVTAGIPRGAASAGAAAAFVGFSVARQRHISGAVVRSLTTMTVHDIYGSRNVRRQVMVLAADVRGGDSGGPLLSADGRYIGMVFGYSGSDAHVGYAVTSQTMQPDVERGVGRTKAVATGRCLG